ncbi:MAG TPA: Spy protein [Cyanobacteria bacterium UBA8553]|nr:Spy protein [Cyanobacteria bacterium UBA8553]HAJ62820.1 Spy protein [Cyanobacteria bacterium UBA8543]
MLLRRVSIWSVLLIVLGGAVVLAKPNLLFPQTVAQNLEGLRRVEGGRWMDQLNLSEEQQQKLQAIRYQYKDQIAQRKQAVGEMSQELRDLMASNASTEEIRAKYQQVQQLRQQLEDVSFESMLATREVMRLDQRQQYAQLMEKRRKDSRHPMGNQRGIEF